jgi:hypothetical protein
MNNPVLVSVLQSSHFKTENLLMKISENVCYFQIIFNPRYIFFNMCNVNISKAGKEGVHLLCLNAVLHKNFTE